MKALDLKTTCLVGFLCTLVLCATLATPITSFDGHAKGTEWQEWADQLISVDDGLDPNWSELLADANAADVRSKVLKPSNDISMQQPLINPNDESHAAANPLSTAARTKSRMHWTPELHEAFVEAVNQLGVSELATLKGVLKLMNVESLTIYHVKSHLQKYRTARHKPEPSEETSAKNVASTEEKKALDLKTTMSITEALRLHMEARKRFQEQVEIQRNLQLQLRFEAQGKYLRQMVEQRRKMENDKSKASSSNVDYPFASLSELEQNSSKNEKSDAKEVDLTKTGAGTGQANTAQQESSRGSTKKPKAPQTEAPEYLSLDDAPGLKRQTGKNE